jgi:hypothetical protein
MEILGSNFVSGDTLTYTDPQGDIYPSTASKLTFVSSGEIEYQLDDDSDPGTWTVKVNSADGTVHSSAASFSVASAVPPPGTPQQGIDVRNVSISNYAENITTAGDAFVGQYIGVNSGYLTTADANTLQSAGLNIVSIYEKSGMSDTDYSLPAPYYTSAWVPYLTEQNGETDASNAALAAAALNQPTGSAIYFAMDLDPGSSLSPISEGNCSTWSECGLAA